MGRQETSGSCLVIDNGIDELAYNLSGQVCHKPAGHWSFNV